MEPLPRLQARIASLDELGDLVGALRAIAATHLQEAQAALPGIRSYSDIVGAAIADAVAMLPDALPAAGAPTGTAAGSVLIAVGSEHGFTGAYNDRLFDRVAAERRPGQRLFVVGRRAATTADERKLDVAQRFAMASHATGVLGSTRRIARSLVNATAVDIIYGRYRTGGGYEFETRRILPLDPEQAGQDGTSAPPLHHLPAETLLLRLADEYLLAELTHAVMESLVSENAARLRAMDTADRNIEDKLADFRRRENTLRQESVTTELLDVVIGSEAILAPDERGA